MKIVLASASPRRKELLKNIFPAFSILPAKGEETAVFENPEQFVKALALAKAEEIAKVYANEKSDAAVSENGESSDDLVLVIGADTIVYSNGKVLGKPADEADAFSMLKDLSGHSHFVYTGVAVYLLKTAAAESAQNPDTAFESAICAKTCFAEATEVFVDSLTDQQIRAYISTGDPLDKAGSYGIQGVFSKHITHINGDYFNVVGLPVSRLYRELQSIELLRPYL